MPEYGNTVLWWTDPNRGNPIDPDALPLSGELRRSLSRWAECYDRTLNQDYPPDSGFATPEEEEAFEVEGRCLWRELQAQLGPEYKVAYFSIREARLME